MIVIIAPVILVVALGLTTYLWQKEASVARDKDRVITEIEATKNNRISQLEAELDVRKETTGEEQIKEDQYQSVFLTNGQTYFGKIMKITETQITLTDIYYLSESGDSLRKLGNELHGPEDVMHIERDKVDYWENLRPDGEVAMAIDEYVRSLR